MFFYKHRWILLLSVFYCCSICGQTKSIDSLKLLLKSESEVLAQLELKKEIGTQLVEHGNYLEGLTWYLESLKLAEARKDTISIANLYNNIAVIYQETNQNKLSFPYSEKAVQLALLTNNNKLKADALNTRGMSFYNDYQDSLALSFFNRSLEFRIKVGDSLKLSAAYNNLGAVYLEMGNVKKGLEFSLKSNRIREKINDIEWLFKSYLHLSDIYFGANKIDSTGFYLDKAELLIPKINSLASKKNYYECRVQYHRTKGAYKEAYEFLRLFVNANDSIMNTEKHRNFAEMQTKYDTEKKELELRARTAELNEQKNAAFYSKVILISILLVLILISVLVIMRLKSKQKLKDEIRKVEQENLNKRTIIETKEKERNRISAELHDNVGSSVSFISSKIDWLLQHNEFSENNKAELKLLKDSSQNVMSGLRETLWTLNSKNISNMDLCDKLKLYIKKHVICQFKITDSLLTEFIIPNEDVLAIYRCTQEIITNINKHSHASMVTVEFISNENKKLGLVINDNGIGFEEIEKVESYGLRNIKTRLKEIGAEIIIRSVKDSGTSIAINYN